MKIREFKEFIENDLNVMTYYQNYPFSIQTFRCSCVCIDVDHELDYSIIGVAHGIIDDESCILLICVADDCGSFISKSISELLDATKKVYDDISKSTTYINLIPWDRLLIEEFPPNLNVYVCIMDDPSKTENISIILSDFVMESFLNSTKNDEAVFFFMHHSSNIQKREYKGCKVFKYSNHTILSSQ